MLIITELELGQVVKDIVSGYTGVITAVKQEISGPVTYLIEPQEMVDNEPCEGWWFPFKRLEVIGETEIANKLLEYKIVKREDT